ncbi:MAG: transglutaminase family protein [Chlorobium sp.]|jgi:transglutaminase-like putative cysteine protease|uniref:transglutaminase family protein n=1 Tax=Chlorobium sp. TaxID=1095 RepID=UPI0025B977ED|nr:transglutaminase family protein [Chlorobium sp.]MCF8216840.1 transglutaminase family protein [Chlorobium sp.]MCF8271685.1 transglutaminase family protein [Chlorobium sp.]MCF8288057.1 transglutaminase family protein [Chlorobium sp.]MCF8291641.1 transglutaminase family protein [Chlorobium sp.]MCF8385756.1 transglutaminase family protein [Chlorobium sp.]
MILKVEHTTLFEYDSPIYETATEVRLHPAENGMSGQHCVNFNLQLNPDASVFEYTDFYGNKVHHFNILQSHKRVQIVATSVVETAPASIITSNENEIFLMDFSGESRYVHFDPEIRSFSEPFRGMTDRYQQSIEICRHINTVFRYEPGVTDVHSTSAVVMALGRGVCQDFAHIMIAVCRNLGLPARYVSGYLFGGGSTPEGHDEASHAWCEVYCGPEKGWTGFDPTHNTLLVDERYIKIGSGRDYADVPPVRGTYKGSADEKLSVSVRVSSLEYSPAQ